MLYKEIIEKHGKNFDPFFHIKKEEIIHEGIYFFIIAARAPYTINHLLIIPKRKVYILKELNNNELTEMHDLVDTRANKLHKIHDSVNLLLRDGLVGGKSNKSVNHLHFHLIPDCEISTKQITDNRTFLKNTEYQELINKIKNTFK